MECINFTLISFIVLLYFARENSAVMVAMSLAAIVSALNSENETWHIVICY